MFTQLDLPEIDQTSRFYAHQAERYVQARSGGIAVEIFVMVYKKMANTEKPA